MNMLNMRGKSMNNTDIHLGLMKCISRLWTIWQYIMETLSMLNVLHFAFTKIFFGNLLLLVIIIQQNILTMKWTPNIKWHYAPETQRALNVHIKNNTLIILVEMLSAIQYGNTSYSIMYRHNIIIILSYTTVPLFVRLDFSCL